MAKQKLGISDDVKAKANVPISPGIVVAALVSVIAEETEIKRGDRKGENQLTLAFTFQSAANPEQTLEHREFPLEIPDEDAGEKATEDFNKKWVALQERIKHIITVYKPNFKQSDLGSFETFDDLFHAVANYFNGIKVGEEKKEEPKKAATAKKADPKAVASTEEAADQGSAEPQPIYKNKAGNPIPVYIKVGYYGNYVSFPYRPNFIEAYKDGKPSTLIWNKNYDFSEPQAVKKAGAAGAPGQPTTFAGFANGNATTDEPSWD